MATLYLDFENGNDNYAGTSFSLLASGTNGRITNTTFSSANASFPNDGSLIGQYLSIFNGTIYAVYNITAWLSSTSLTIAALSGGTALANQTVDRQYYIGGRWKNITTGATAVRTMPGDTIRIMGSPAPTSLGQNGVWTSSALQATKAITGASNASPISITCTSHGYSTGDTVVITGVNGNTNANGTWEITSTGANTFTLDGSAGNAAYTSGGTARLRNNTRVKLASAVTQNIASTGPGRAAWTASTNVTATLSPSNVKEHAASDYISIAGAFTTGKAAYWPLPSTLDLSSYQQISFWVVPGGGGFGSISAGALEIRLCSDTTGDTAVDTLSIPLINGASRQHAITINKGSALGSSIASIALYVVSDLSAGIVDLYFNNIIACKASSAADSLTLTSLIGKNTTGETFWGIQSINGTRVMLDADTNATPTSTTVRGYYGTSETVTTWKRETIKLGPVSSSTTPLQTIQESGSEGSPITYSGGWDRTNMSTQNLETWLDGQNGNGYSMAIQSSMSWISINKVAFTRSGYGIFVNSSANYLDCSVVSAVGLTSSPIWAQGAGNRFTFGHIITSTNIYQGSAYAELVFTIQYGAFSNINGLPQTSTRMQIYGEGATIANTGNAVLSLTATSGLLNGITTVDNAGSAVDYASSTVPYYYMYNCLFNDTIEVNLSNNFAGIYMCSHKHDKTANNHKIFTDGGLISSATDQRHTASGISWKIQPTSSTLRNSYRPLILSLAKVACAANSLVTIKAWMRRDNTGLTMRLVCKGGQIDGVSSNVVSAMTAAANTWEELTITFTPTEIGVVEITAEAWGGTTYSGWVDDMTISQA